MKEERGYCLDCREYTAIKTKGSTFSRGVGNVICAFFIVGFLANEGGEQGVAVAIFLIVGMILYHIFFKTYQCSKCKSKNIIRESNLMKKEELNKIKDEFLDERQEKKEIYDFYNDRRKKYSENKWK